MPPKTSTFYTVCLCCVGGTAGAVSRITGTLGKGIAKLTFDEEHQRKRREQLNKRPDDVTEGIARGGRGLVTVSEQTIPWEGKTWGETSHIRPRALSVEVDGLSLILLVL